MNPVGLIYLLTAHYLCGRGILKLVKISLSPVGTTCLSFMIGVPVLSFVPCFLQLLHIPIVLSSVGIGVFAYTFALCIPLLIQFKRPRITGFPMPKLYEIPFIAVILFLMSVSVWRCFYYPPTSRDMLTGPELLAAFAVREHTMISSVFTIDLQTTNNYFKSPYITGLQIIYKMLVCPFGQLWLSLLSLSFVAWLYTLLRASIHPLIAGLLLLLFITIPDMYAYSYVILYDYSNMLFFFCGFYFLNRFLIIDNIYDLILSALLFGFATYIRTETIVLIIMVLPLILVFFARKQAPLGRLVRYSAIFILVPAAFYVLCIHVFIHNFIPIRLDLEKEINPHLGNISVFFFRIRDMATGLIFSKLGMSVYGSFIYCFLGLLLIDIIWPRRFNQEALFALYGVVVVYIGMAFLGYLLPLADLTNTTKRGLFKMLPLMLLYMCNSGILLWLSDKIRQWTAGE